MLINLIILCLVGYIDWQHRRIPNSLVVILAGWAACYAAFSSEVSVQSIFVNIGIGLALTVPGYIKGVVGGGDVKLMLALAPIYTTPQLLWVFSIGIGSLLFLMAVLHLAQRMPLTKAYYPNYAVQPSAFKRGLPLGSAIALGAIALAFINGF
ncbi:prepilin peptidase [Zhongshania borealis]|uniref:Prepilin type IV endopeptidase peptidase domain-containing protein n=1 Tax=Zhongshania borealis TaxID=889488 RepID=A0ABP7WFY3_9GAMM